MKNLIFILLIISAFFFFHPEDTVIAVDPDSNYYRNMRPEPIPKTRERYIWIDSVQRINNSNIKNIQAHFSIDNSDGVCEIIADVNSVNNDLIIRSCAYETVGVCSCDLNMEYDMSYGVCHTEKESHLCSFVIGQNSVKFQITNYEGLLVNSSFNFSMILEE